MTDVDLEVVVPALNEEARIGETISTLCEHLSGRPWSSRIIVVDNGSIDGTAAVVDRSKSGVDVRVIGCRTRGKGAAVRAGVIASHALWVGYCDADLPVAVDCIDRAVDLLKSGHEVVVGSRRCPGAKYVVTQPWHRKAGSLAFRRLSGRLTGEISDTQCGFKFFDGALGRELFAATELSGFAFDIELLACARQSGVRVREMPVEWRDHEGSTFRPIADGVAAVRELLAVKRAVRKRTGRQQATVDRLNWVGPARERPVAERAAG